MSKNNIGSVLLVSGWMITVLLFTGYADVSDEIAANVKVLSSERQSAAKYKPELQKAWRSFNIGDTQKAHDLFQQVESRPDATEAEKVQALFGLATNYQFAIPKGKPEKARQYFRRIIEEYPNNSTASWALLKLGTMEGSANLDARNRARKYYREVLAQYPSGLAIHEATLRLAQTYFFELEPEEAANGMEILENHMKQYPDNPLASSMLFRLSYWYSEVERDYENSYRHGRILGELQMADPQRWGMQFWNVAQTLRFRLNQPEESLKWYRKLIDDCPYHYLVLPSRIAIAQLHEQLNEQAEE